MNILIPMAGEGSRFKKAGYTFPKPLIDVDGKPMIQRVIENLDFDANYIFLVRKDHLEKYNISELLEFTTNGKCEIVVVDELTEGAACTALLAKKFINNEKELLIANSDQIIEYSKYNFNTLRRYSDFDSMVFTFNAVHPKWSFVKVNSRGIATEVAEKKPISNIATCGIYYYRRGSEFVKYAERMIQKNLRVNNEFYICPVYNELIQDEKTLVPYFVDKMHGLGTPEDLKAYLKI
ncbi:MAG TPA: glycosyl transferase family 2 [Maribacter sp.]|nr:glycosyl transferase family 2 [Maribacter sp.]